MKITGAVISRGQIFSCTRLSVFLSLLLILLVSILDSCTKTNEFTIGQNFMESQTRLQVIDTFKVDIGSVLLDSISTSSSKVALVGHYSDSVFGDVSSEAYFDLGYQNFTSIEENAIYDSAAFNFYWSGYCYGDTTALISIGLHQLTEKIVPFSNSNLYNVNSFEYSPEPLGTAQFVAELGAYDSTMVIPVNELGELLFGLYRNKDERISNSENFSEFLKGFVLTSSNDLNRAILSFTADISRLNLKIYYHLEEEFPENKQLTLQINESNHQFNHIEYNFTNTPLNGIGQGNNELPGSETGNKAFIQGLTGLLAKVQFPTMQNILMEQRWKIIRADLVFQPARNSYDFFKLPSKLNLYETDRENRINALVVDSEGRALLPDFVYDEFYNTDTRYTFNITRFINKELSDNYFDYEHGLLIGLEQTEFLSTLERLVIEGKNPPVKLRIYYLTY
jgi:hypothetical protein